MADIDKLGSDMDALMDKILEDPTLATKQDIDAVIAYQRKYRTKIDAGEKRKKAEGPQIDLVQMGLIAAKEPMKRRV